MKRKYLVIYQAGPNHLSACAPDLPGCSSIGHSMVELRENIHDELEFHLERMALEGRTIPEPFMGMDDISLGVHAEWMIVSTRPVKALTVGAKIGRWLRRSVGFKRDLISRSAGGVKVRTRYV